MKLVMIKIIFEVLVNYVISRNWGNETPEDELRMVEISNCARL